jgi:hypothetical protein
MESMGASEVSQNEWVRPWLGLLAISLMAFIALGTGCALNGDVDAADSGPPDAATVPSDAAADRPSDDAAVERVDGNDGSSVDLLVGGDAGGADGLDATDDAILGPAPLTYPEFVAGTRLHVERIQAADGTDVALNLYDTKIDAPCWFAPGEDSTFRCLPFHYVQNVAFEDSGCTRPVLLLSACETFGEWAGQGMFGGYGVFRVGPPTSSPATVWRPLTDAAGNTSCVPDDLPPNADAARALERITPDTFVAGTIETRAPPPYHLGATYFVAEDGAQQRESLWDAKAGARCMIFPTQGGVRRCVNLDYPWVTPSFADDQCTVPIYVESPYIDPALPAPTMVVTFRNPLPGQEGFACGSVASVLKVVSVYQGTRYDRSSGQGCAPLAVQGSTTAYLLAPADVAAEVAPAVIPDSRGGTRLKLSNLRELDGPAFEMGPENEIFDSRYGEVCSFVDTAVGLACVPSTNPAANGFTDNTCTTPVFDFGEESCLWPHAVPVHEPIYAPATCGPGPVVKILGRGEQVDTFFTTSAAGCVPSPTAQTLFTAGPELPLADLVSGTFVHD